MTQEASRTPPDSTGSRRGKRASGSSSDYTAASIQVLEGLEAVRRRPGMYIGSTDARGLHHLVWEVVDNSIDEAMAGHATKIDVTIHADGMVDGRRRRSRRAGRQAFDRQGRARGRPHRPARRRQVRRRRLQGVRRPPRRRRQRRQRPVRRGCGSSRPATATSGPRSTSAASRRRAVKKIGPSNGRRGTTTQFRADAEMFETIDYSFETISQRLRESAYLTKGVWITLIDERIDRERSFYFEGGLVSFVRHLNRNKEVLHSRPIYCEKREGSDVGRGRAPVQRHLHRERPRVREQHQHGRRRHARHRLPRRADELPERLGPPGRAS